MIFLRGNVNIAKKSAVLLMVSRISDIEGRLVVDIKMVIVLKLQNNANFYM